MSIILRYSVRLKQEIPFFKNINIQIEATLFLYLQLLSKYFKNRINEKNINLSYFAEKQYDDNDKFQKARLGHKFLNSTEGKN